jgi:hypothetical protein
MNRQQLINTISIVQWRVRNKFRRYREAFAYARKRIPACSGLAVEDDVVRLETLSVDGCLQTALDCYWEDHPELESLVQSACKRVASKWSSTGDAASRRHFSRRNPINPAGYTV